MKMRIIGIGIVAVALILAISMTASANPDPVGATTSVQNNNVSLGAYSIASDTYTHSNALGEGVNAIYINVTTATTGITGLTIDYTKEDGSTGTATPNIPISAIGTWITVDTVTDLVNITSVSDDNVSGVGVIDIVANVSRQKMHQVVGGTDSAKGGFVTEIDFAAVAVTAKWQGYYGNVSGSIALKDSQGNAMFTWDWNAADGGEVIATTNTSIPPWALVNLTNATDMTAMETAWSWDANTSDGPLITFENSTDDVTIAGVLVNNTNGTSRLGAGTAGDFTEVVLKNGASAGAAKNDFLFVGIINASKEAFDGTIKDFEMLVATPDTVAAGDTETYYFYVEMT